MEKKFITIMVAIILFLGTVLSVLLMSNGGAIFGRDYNDTPPFNIGLNEAVAEQDAEGNIFERRTFPPEQVVVETFSGNIFDFGGLTWRVLDVRDGKMLIISEHVVEYRSYHPRFDINLSWETSDMRNWLNSEFYNRFEEADRARIAETNVINNGNFWFWYETPGGEDTTDKIFLLSLEELTYYFGDSGVLTRERTRPEGSVIRDRYNTNRRAHKLNRHIYSYWWLRTPGSSVGWAMFVTDEGHVWMFGMNARAIGVRPALWLYMTPLDYVGVALTYISLWQLDEAIAILQQGLEKFPRNTEIQTLLTAALERDVVFPAPEIQSVIKFGGMQWRVLDVKENQVLVLSEFVLEPRAYHSELVYTTWADSDIRRWLNSEFYNRFTDEERRHIAETKVINNDNPWFGAPGGPDTTDKVFLLSLEELALYFCDSGRLARRGLVGSSRWAISNQFGDRLKAFGFFGDGLTQVWWLRSPGSHGDMAANVSFFGVVYVSGYFVDCYRFKGIRPAMWLYL